jgi:hypothetical protein
MANQTLMNVDVVKAKHGVAPRKRAVRPRPFQLAFYPKIDFVPTAAADLIPNRVGFPATYERTDTR